MTLPVWTLQDRIRKAREHAGLKQDELAQRMETTRQTLGRWENGSHTLTGKNLQALAEVTGVPYEWIKDGNPQTEPIGLPREITVNGTTYEAKNI